MAIINPQLFDICEICLQDIIPATVSGQRQDCHYERTGGIPTIQHGACHKFLVSLYSGRPLPFPEGLTMDRIRQYLDEIDGADNLYRALALMPPKRHPLTGHRVVVIDPRARERAKQEAYRRRFEAEMRHDAAGVR